MQRSKTKHLMRCCSTASKSRLASAEGPGRIGHLDSAKLLLGRALLHVPCKFGMHEAHLMQELAESLFSGCCEPNVNHHQDIRVA